MQKAYRAQTFYFHTPPAPRQGTRNISTFSPSPQCTSALDADRPRRRRRRALTNRSSRKKRSLSLHPPKRTSNRKVFCAREENQAC